MDQKTKKQLKGLNKDLITLIDAVIKKSQHTIKIKKDGGKRTPQIQNNIFHTKPITTTYDGFKRISKHQTGEAFNIEIENPTTEIYKEISTLFKEEFNLMKESSSFEDHKTLKWGGDEVRYKFEFHYEIE